MTYINEIFCCDICGNDEDVLTCILCESEICDECLILYHDDCIFL